MTIARVQTTGFVVPVGATLTLPLTGVTAGNLLVVGLIYYQSGSLTAIGTPTDTGGTMVSAVTPTGLTIGGTDLFGVSQWYEKNCAAGTHTVVITGHGSFSARGVLGEYAGADTTAPLDQPASSGSIVGTQSRASGTTAALAAATDMAFALIGQASGAGVANAAFTNPPAGYSSLGVQNATNSDVGGEMADMANLGSAAATSTSWTWTDGTTVASFGAIATYKAAAGGNVTLSLTGQTATFTEGSIARAIAYAVTGQTATFAEGSITPAVSSALSGQTATFTEGTPTPAVTYSLTAQTATFSEGTITATTGGNVTLNLTGQSATFTQGTLSSAISTALTAQTITASEGTLSPQLTYGLAGQTAIFTEGIITSQAGGDITLQLTGLQAVFSLGTITANGGDLPTTQDTHDPKPWIKRKKRFDDSAQTQVIRESQLKPKKPKRQDRVPKAEVPLPKFDAGPEDEEIMLLVDDEDARTADLIELATQILRTLH